MKKDKLITVYCAHGDGGERALGPIIGVYSDEYSAKAAAKTSGWYGGDGGVTKRKAVLSCNNEYHLTDSVYEGALDLDGSKKRAIEEAKVRGLKKLTEFEKQALGLTK